MITMKKLHAYRLPVYHITVRDHRTNEPIPPVYYSKRIAQEKLRTNIQNFGSVQRYWHETLKCPLCDEKINCLDYNDWTRHLRNDCRRDKFPDLDPDALYERNRERMQVAYAGWSPRAYYTEHSQSEYYYMVNVVGWFFPKGGEIHDEILRCADIRDPSVENITRMLIQLREHLQRNLTVSKTTLYKCEYCGDVFRTLDGLRRHYETFHGQNREQS